MTQATTFAELATEAQRQTLSALKQAHDLSIRGAELAAGLRETGTRSVPNAKEAVEGAFAFAGQVLQQQKAYAVRMTEIVTENLEKTANGAKPAAKSTK
jgi:hypothetical protein